MSDAQGAVYEVYAVRYGSMDRKRGDNFIAHDSHDVAMPLDYFVWLLRSKDRVVLVDTGFSHETAKARDRVLERCPIEALRVLDVDPATITDVVITHLHYDHAGNLDKLPAARFHLQDAEMEYATGRCMCHGVLRHAYNVDDVVSLVRKVYADRVVFHAGDATLAPGIELMLIGGHTRGLQSVRVRTTRGWVVLASDASHFYENYESERPFPIVVDVADMLQGHRKLQAAADSPQHLVPGHDPLVLQRYPRWPGDEPGIACLHLPPSG
jgi:glyoxylase-like metal-dependent hydrolase (beta-lactamase superfamily II)